MSISANLSEIKASLPANVTLVAVSKTKPASAIMEAYQSGQLKFGENKVQELVDKAAELPKDIQWHLIGHLQTNKVKYIAPFVSLIHSADSLKLLHEIDKQAGRNKRIIDCLIQVHIAEETSKFGMSYAETRNFFNENIFRQFPNIRVVGLMGMATNTEDEKVVRKEFRNLKEFFEEIRSGGYTLNILSMGMSHDHKIAIEEGSNMVRIGSAIFGDR